MTPSPWVRAFEAPVAAQQPRMTASATTSRRRVGREVSGTNQATVAPRQAV